MVELSRQSVRAVSFQAGPGEAGPLQLHETNFRIGEGALRTIGQQLASIGDKLHQERTSKHNNRHPALLHYLQLVLRPAQALTRKILRNINSQMWELKGSSVTVKAWVLGTMTGQRVFEPPNWMSTFLPVTWTGWTKRKVVAVTAVALCCALWIEWKA